MLHRSFWFPSNTFFSPSLWYLQDDSHSQRVLEDLLSVLVPCWLSRTTSIEKLLQVLYSCPWSSFLFFIFLNSNALKGCAPLLLQIFIKALADVPEHRRLTLMVYLLRSFYILSSLIFSCFLLTLSQKELHFSFILS